MNGLLVMDNCPLMCLCPRWRSEWQAGLILCCGQAPHALTARTRSQLHEWAVFNQNIQPELGEWSGVSGAHQEAPRHDNFFSSLSPTYFWTSDPKTISKLWIDVGKTWLSCCYLVPPVITTAVVTAWDSYLTSKRKNPAVGGKDTKHLQTTFSASHHLYS